MRYAAASPLEMQLDVMDEWRGWAIGHQEIAVDLDPALYTVTLSPRINPETNRYILVGPLIAGDTCIGRWGLT